MSYTKTQWNNDTAPAINETNLNKIEQGIYDNDSAITTINTNIGDLSDLETTTQTDIVGAINENVDNIGDLTTLTPTADTDLVSAINEVDSHADTNSTNIGDLTTLTTTAKSNVVSAVNELDSLKATKDVATASANGLMSASDKIKLDTIIESGSNANGWYIKYLDGTMICYDKIAVNLDISQAIGSLYRQTLQNTINYPASFASTPIVTITIENDVDYCFCWVYAIQRTVSAITRVDVLRPVQSNGVGTLCYTAVGRWK